MEVLINGDRYIKQVRLPQNAPLSERVLGCEVEAGVTVRMYLYRLLNTLWNEGECFSSKRPFGNSAWETDLCIALAKGGLVDGFVFDEEGYLEQADPESKRQAEALISDAIAHLFSQPIKS